MDCKLCSKKFSNGKALGGHMRSHFAYATLPLPPKTAQRQDLTESLTDSTSSIFSCDERESSGDKSSLLSGSRGLRERPRKSLRLVDPDAVVDLERESESTRARFEGAVEEDVVGKKAFLQKPPLMSELEEMEEDVASSLIMLSRDVWRTPMAKGEKIYRCERCDRVFKSSQGLGSHMANHHLKKINHPEKELGKPENVGKEQTDHECSLCGRVFRSAQSLGGHKRAHTLASKLSTTLVEDRSPIDLNLPPEFHDEDEEYD